MNVEDYDKVLTAIKQGLYNEIANLLSEGEFYQFEHPFFIQYKDGELCTTDVCHAVEKDGELMFVTSGALNSPKSHWGRMGYTMIWNYDIESYVRVLENLRAEKEEK